MHLYYTSTFEASQATVSPRSYGFGDPGITRVLEPEFAGNGTPDDDVADSSPPPPNVGFPKEGKESNNLRGRVSRRRLAECRLCLRRRYYKKYCFMANILVILCERSHFVAQTFLIMNIIMNKKFSIDLNKHFVDINFNI